MGEKLSDLEDEMAGKGSRSIVVDSTATGTTTTVVGAEKIPSPESTISRAVSDRWSLAHRYHQEFEEKRQLGRGGFGTVHQAWNKMDETDYAVKKVRLSSRHLSKIEKMLREVRILAQLDHKHIIRYYQAWIEPITREEQDEMAAERQEQQQLGLSLIHI